jgi:hypothetical protein
MGILDPKERILDVVLTNRGKELLSKNQLDFTYYAFSDEEIDYSGSLSASIMESSSIDDQVFRNLSFESDQRKKSLGTYQRTLETFLFTIPSRRKVLPEFKTSLDERGGSVTADKSFYTEKLFFRGKKVNRTEKPIAAVVKGSIFKNNQETRISEYALEQKVRATNDKLEKSKNAVGMPLSKDYIVISSNKALNKKTGLVASISDIQKFREDIEQNTAEATSIKREIEIVAGLDTVKVDFQLKSSEGEVPVSDGFLIEIFESGSDGQLTKLVRKTVEDPVNGERLKNGFESFLDVEVDSKWRLKK